VSNSIHSQVSAAARHVTAHLSAAQLAAATKAITDHAYSTGFAKGYLVSAGIALLGLSITVIAIRVKRSDLAGLKPIAPPADAPSTGPASSRPSACPRQPATGHVEELFRR
jgi:hypothetical protein